MSDLESIIQSDARMRFFRKWMRSTRRPQASLQAIVDAAKRGSPAPASKDDLTEAELQLIADRIVIIHRYE